VKLSNIFSDWLSLNGGMPQGSWLGPPTFIVLIDCLLVGPCTSSSTTQLCQRFGKDGVSQMETYCGDVLNWSALNLMNIDITTTKEMIVGANVNPPPQLIFNYKIIERVFVYKLLGVLIVD